MYKICSIAVVIYMVGYSSVFAEIPSDLARYLNGIKYLSADILQVRQNGATESGRIYIKKPGKMRIDYTGKLNIVINHDKITMYNPRLNELSYATASILTAQILTNKNVKWDRVIRKIEQSKNNYVIVMHDTIQGEDSEFCIVLDRRPIKLTQISTTRHNEKIIVSLSNVDASSRINDSKFILKKQDDEDE